MFIDFKRGAAKGCASFFNYCWAESPTYFRQLKNKGTILVFKDCHKDIIDKDSFIEDIKNLKHCYDTKDEAIEKLTAYIS